PFGIVVLEAWSAGKPVIASQNGGPAEYVRHEVDGLKIYPNPDSVAWGVGHMFSDLDRARWMGQNGRKAVKERFTWDTITEQMLAIYQSLCPSPAMLPHRATGRVRAVLAESQHETSWAGVFAEKNALVAISEEGTHGPYISVRAKVHCRTTDPDEADEALTACKSSPTLSSLNPQRRDRTLTATLS
ncbi:MAG: glycosyltransferase family 4 protein, partial [Phycisphaerales bacterium]